jgi:hypothetical protein
MIPFLSKRSKTKIHTTIISRVFFLCGCETWSLNVREDHRLKMFENRVLRGIFGSKREEVRAVIAQSV